MSTSLALVDAAPTVTAEQVALIKTTIAKEATDSELALFFYDCRRQGVHPLDRLIHFTKRNNRYVPITSIDFMRQRAAETHECAGIEDVVFTGTPKTPAFTATVTVYRLVQGQRCAYTASARWLEYKPDHDFMWQKMPYVMLGKCAEALALRKGFPLQLAGLYAKEELDQADTVELGACISPAQRKRLFTVATEHGWNEAAIKQELLKQYDVQGTNEIRTTQYDAIVEHFMHPPIA